MLAKTAIAITLLIVLSMASQTVSQKKKTTLEEDFRECWNECPTLSHMCMTIAISEGTLEDFARCSVKLCQRRCRNLYFIRRS